MKTPDKKRKEAERKRMKERGLKRFEAWVHPDDFPAVRKYVTRLQMIRAVDRAVKKRTAE